MKRENMNVNGEQIELDKDGYLLHSAQWNEVVALALAEKDQLELSEAHWEVIHFVRDFYQEYQTSPAIRMLVKAMADKLGADKGNSRYLQRLFPDGPAKQATKLAGLPKPAKCL
ncbi:TusE/DsrC/DsvC family sulfur relay protein [Pasteurella testudinis]|uniref:TusE/DsrC/DsvC family sulfur relay protein n=1 Tax=Pasteurella testudinis TaxID=761 RepID=UPI0040588ECD